MWMPLTFMTAGHAGCAPPRKNMTHEWACKVFFTHARA